MAITDYQPQRTPEGTSPPLRLWLDTEHRRIAQALLNVASTDQDETITGNWGFDGTVDFDGAVGFDGAAVFDSTVDINGVLTVDGAATFTASPKIEGATQAALVMVDLDAGTDEKAIQLRHNNAVTNLFNTLDATPGSVTGAGTALQLTRSGVTPLTVRLPNDNQELRFGASGDDLAIYHDGTNNNIDSNTGSLSLRDSGAATKFQINATGVAFWGQTPAARPDYTVTNPSTDRAFDVSSAAIGEVRAVLGTLISDLIAIGLLQ